MQDDLSQFAERYHSLAVETCEWRAFGVADPEQMADQVFERLGRKQVPPTLSRFYKEVQFVVGKAYEQAAGQHTIMDLFRNPLGGKRGPKTADDLARDALQRVRQRDLELLQLAYWDDLTPDELAEVQRTDATTALARLNAATAAFGKRLPTGEDDPSSVMRRIKPGTHRR